MKVAGDFWGGLAAMLVVLPASLAFGVTIYAAIGPEYAGLGALAGILGAVALGIIAPILGGTDRLITAPCAPATALLSAFAIAMVAQGTPAMTIVLLMILLTILAGIFQVIIGFTRVGSLMKYLPHTVVSGYMTAVGLIIIISQLPSFVGLDPTTQFLKVIFHPDTWQMPALIIGLLTALGMAFGGRLTHFFPSTIIGITFGISGYAALSLWLPELRELSGNSLVLGEMNVALDGYVSVLSDRWTDIGYITLGQVASLFGTALTLAVLLSIDTLKTGIIVDQLTHSRHEPNKELVAQGIANMSSGAIGGIPGSGTMGPTLVNVSSGAQTRYSGVVAGALALVGLVVLASFLAWLPKATLSAVLIVIGIKMIDVNAIKLITARSTVFDFVVVASVVVVALTFGLIAASAVGVIMAIVLFLREQVGGSVIHRRSLLNQRSSSWYRTEQEAIVLEKEGYKTVILELQGSLFFGTARQLYNDLETDARKSRHLILDMLRVTSIDVTAAHVLAQMYELMKHSGCKLIFANFHDRQNVDVQTVLLLMGVKSVDHDDPHRDVCLFESLDEAIEWVENQLLGKDKEEELNEEPLCLSEMELFQSLKPETIADMASLMAVKTFPKDTHIYEIGDPGDALYLLRRGRVKIIAPIGGGRRLHHIATIGRGNFFGGMSFLDGQKRGDIAVADTDIEVFVITSEQFNQLAETHKHLTSLLIQALAKALSHRLRRTDGELTLLLE